MLRVLVLLNAFALDGPGRLVYGLVRQWIRQGGVDVRVAALTRGGPLEKTIEELGISAETVAAQGLGMLRTARSWALRTRESFTPQVLHTHLARPDLLGPSLQPLLGNPRLVSTNHGLHAWWEKGRWKGRIYRRLYRLRQNRFDRIVAVSRATADELYSEGIHRERIAVIPNGIDPEEFRPAVGAQKREFRQAVGIEPVEGFLLLVVGNLIPLKGQEYVIRALPAILEKFPDTRLLLVGEGPLEEHLNQVATSAGVRHACMRISTLSVLLPKLMASADLLIHPSLVESFGLVVAEAQACGLPVVASRIGGLSEILLDGETGYLVPEGDPASIADAVLRLLTNREVLREMGAAGRQRVLQLFDIRRCAKDYLTLFRKIVPGTAAAETSATTPS